ncbi:unnamed protein product [Urochloa humidicola]
MASQGEAAATSGHGCADDNGGTTQAAVHFVFVPLVAQGHLIPAVDTALLLASHGAVCTIAGTPATAAHVRPTVDSARQTGLQVRLVEFPLDYAAVGLPEGADMHNVLVERMDKYFDVPRVIFFSMSAFCLLCDHNVERFHAFDGVAGDNEPVVVPGLERRFVVTRAQLPQFFRGIPVPWWQEFADFVERAQAQADGVIMNTFVEMEPEYVAGYAAARKMKVWTVGPVSLYHQRGAGATLAARGNAAAIDAGECLQWLDGKAPGSVIYVSFGSVATTDGKQAVELGLGLEASGHPFIWVLRNAHDYDDTTRAFLEELEARVAGRGLLVRGWAPQLLILSHAAVGGFVTHCGWNSTLEAATAGLPVVTWPHFTDQFLNEKLAVEVLGIGVSIGVIEPLMYRAAEKEMVVKRGVVEKAVRSVMDGGEEAEERRRRARVLAAKARAAMQEGGSSHCNLLDLVDRFKAAA